MRTSTHDRTVNFRASSKLMDAATERARDRGMSLAELIRQGIRTAAFDQPNISEKAK